VDANNRIRKLLSSNCTEGQEKSDRLDHLGHSAFRNHVLLSLWRWYAGEAKERGHFARELHNYRYRELWVSTTLHRFFPGGAITEGQMGQRVGSR